MSKLTKINNSPITHPKNIIKGDKFRISVLTSRLLRLEYSENGLFEDRPSQTILNRDFPPATYQVIQDQDSLEIDTDYLHLYYNKKEFSSHGLKVQIKGNLTLYHSVWRYGKSVNDHLNIDFKGTAKTLDGVDGECELEDGIVSYYGFKLLDDSKSLILTDDGFVCPRDCGQAKDLYLFAYGHDYRAGLNDFYYLSGKTPMLPRYALGNWWSRYYKYSQEGYLALMDKFDAIGLPLSIAVIDMDWHYVDIDPKYGSGWTGYTWNKDLFPDPNDFLKDLHNRGLKVTLNDHPAEGVQAFEDAYPDFAKALGIDPASEKPIEFDITDPDFLKLYFDHVHGPLEKMGVDFWWIDWQQGESTKIEGLDPLWMLNHYHFLHHEKENKRGMIFSRYAGPGSHRYPVGFSGDTISSWQSLNFQPYFTASASNIGYGWWSHDIGGHMHGKKDDELMVRWLQFGVFSPINRLHSSNNLFAGKEPWRYPNHLAKIMINFLRIRHQLIPYLYTMNFQSYNDNRPLIEPIAYDYPDNILAYKHKNNYNFGRNLLVAPITSPLLDHINMAKTSVWLGEDDYIDIFTGQHYKGNGEFTLYRSLSEIPVLAKAGTILPLTDEMNAQLNPNHIYIKVYPGKDGSFTLYEDDNHSKEYLEGVCATTNFELKYTKKTTSFTIKASQDDFNIIPPHRKYTIDFINCGTEDFEIYLDNELISLKKERLLKNVGKGTLTRKLENDYFMDDVLLGSSPTGKNGYLDLSSPKDFHYSFDDIYKRLTISLGEINKKSTISIKFPKKLSIEAMASKRRVFDFLNQAEIDFSLKEKIYSIFLKNMCRTQKIKQLHGLNLDLDLLGVLIDFI